MLERRGANALVVIAAAGEQTLDARRIAEIAGDLHRRFADVRDRRSSSRGGSARSMSDGRSSSARRSRRGGRATSVVAEQRQQRLERARDRRARQRAAAGTSSSRLVLEQREQAPARPAVADPPERHRRRAARVDIAVLRAARSARSTIGDPKRTIASIASCPHGLRAEQARQRALDGCAAQPAKDDHEIAAAAAPTRAGTASISRCAAGGRSARRTRSSMCASPPLNMRPRSAR